MNARPEPPRLSIVIPVLDESGVIRDVVARARGEADEVVVCDGGSTDATLDLARHAGSVVCSAPRGRGRQLDHGAAAASGDVLLFLHADTLLPPGAGAAVLWAAAHSGWGCFSVRIESTDPRLRWCGRYMTTRARQTGSVTGDMAIWCRRAWYDQVGGFGPRGVCEDLDFAQRLRAIAPGLVLPLRVGTSARRWEAEGVTQTILRMWMVRSAFYAGASESTLARLYRSRPR